MVERKFKKEIRKIRLILYQALPIDLGLYQNLTREGCKQKFNKKQLDGGSKLRADYLVYLDGQYWPRIGCKIFFGNRIWVTSYSYNRSRLNKRINRYMLRHMSRLKLMLSSLPVFRVR